MDRFAYEADLAGGPHAASLARTLVRRELGRRISPALLADVALLVTELVANGVRHGGDGGPLHLTLRGRDRGLWVEVVDPGRDPGRVATREPSPEGGGMGLFLVDRIASRWGVSEAPPTSVWFEVDCR